jgi:hypothetical protein
MFPLGCREVRFSFESAADAGMYAALNRGFARVAGDVMSWINGDDRLQPGALATVLAVLTSYPETEWLGGRHAYINGEGSQVALLEVMPFARPLVEMGLYENRRIVFLQQEGVFWRRELWEKCGSRLDDTLRYAGDFELWCRFAGHAEYVSVDTVLGVFRVHQAQATDDLSLYYREVDALLVGDRKRRREELWALFREARRLGRAPISIDLSGPVVTYDKLTRCWTLSRRSCLGDFSPRDGPLSRRIRMLAHLWLSRRKAAQKG